MLAVLKAAAERFGWTAARAGKAAAGGSRDGGVGGAEPDVRRGVGVACGVDACTTVATMAEVLVEPKTGAVRVKRVVSAQDMGTVVNPAGAADQLEGAITMGLGYALAEEVRFKDGKVLSADFGGYAIPRFSWVPSIETVLLESKDTPPQGGGEPGIVTIGAVVANAICDATGARLLQLPMTPPRVLAALGR
jgi:nicotinate dehydrogenase subunit B